MCARLVALVVALICGLSLQSQAPRIDSIDPAQGSISGGTLVAIKGAALQGGALFLDKSAINPSFVSASEIRFITPSHANGIVTIRLVSGAGAAATEYLFTPPKLVDLPPGYITTVAGVGFFSGYYRQATQAEIQPQGSPAYDSGGNLYIPEPGYNRVSRVRPDGVIEPFAGNGLGGPPQDNAGDGGTATDATVTFPRGVTTDASGNVYLTDSTSRIRRVDSRGVISTIAGGAGSGYSGDGGPAAKAQLSVPSHITGDGKGTIFFIDCYNSGGARIRKIATDGIISTVAGSDAPGFSGDGGPATNAQFNLLFCDLGSLARDAQGNLYVADSGNYRIRKIDATTGMISTLYVLPGGTDAPPRTVAVDAAGNIYFDQSQLYVRKISPAGQLLATYGTGIFQDFTDDGTPIAAAAVNGVQGLAIDPGGNLIYADGNKLSQRVRILNFATGKQGTLAGMGPRVIGESGPAIAATLQNTNGDLTILPSGELVIGDDGHSLIRKIDAAGNISTRVKASAIAVKSDATGNVYVSDEGSIALVSPNGASTRIIGYSPQCDLSGDGAPAISAHICQAWDLARDAAGNLFIADSNNNRIRRVDAQSGVITTVVGSGKTNGLEHYWEGTYCGDGGPATQACINTPLGIALDGLGNMFIAESNRIRRVAANGIITTFANPPTIHTKLLVDAGGYLYGVSGGALLRYDSSGASTVLAGDADFTKRGFSGDAGPATQARLQAGLQAEGIAIDAEGNIFFNDGENQRIRAIRFGAVLPPPGVQIQASRGTPQNASLIAAFPIALEATLSDSNGRAAPSVRVEFTAPSSGPSCAFANGTTFAAAITDRNGRASIGCVANATPGTFSVSATPVASTLTAKFSLTNAAPLLPNNSLVNAASFAAGPVAPGEIVTIFGTGIGPAQASLAQVVSGALTTVLGQTRVLFDGIAAPMIFAQANQVSAIVPYSLAGKASAQLQLEYAGTKSNALQTGVTAAAPAIFSANSSGSGQGAILNEDNSYNSPANPASRGSVLQIFATGEGQTDPPGADGKITGTTLPKPVLPVHVTIGAQDAEVIYAGAAPGQVAGLFQVNARIPANVATGSAVLVVLTVGNTASPTGIRVAIK